MMAWTEAMTMRDDDEGVWVDVLWLAGFIVGLGLLGAGIVMGAAYWAARGVAL